MTLKNLAFAFSVFLSLGLLSCNGGLDEVPLTDDEILKSDLKIINEWLDKNNLTDSVVITSTGLRYIPSFIGTGLKVDSGDRISVNYVGRHFNDQIFDESEEGSPLFTIINDGRLISGFNEGLDSMRVGSRFTILMHSKLAYGRAGYSVINPNEPIYFEVEVVSNPQEQNILNWLDENNYADQIITFSNGLRYLIFHDESGSNISGDSEVTINYEGRLLNTGSIFDTSFPAGKGKDSLVFVPSEGEVINGMALAVRYMSKGDSAMIVVPSKLGFGQYQRGSIPANSPLVFRIKIEDVK